MKKKLPKKRNPYAKAVKKIKPKVKPSKKHGIAGDMPTTKNPDYLLMAGD